MNTYWDSFIDLYKEVIPYRSLIQILEAFYRYSNNDITGADKIMIE